MKNSPVGRILESRGFLGALSRYTVAVVVVAVVTALRFALQRTGPFQPVFILFCPAVLFVAMRAGFWPGIVATLLSSISGAYFFEEPRSSLHSGNAELLLGPALFALVGVCLTLFTSSRDRALTNLRAREQRMDGLFNHQVVGMAITSPEKRWMEVNDTWCKMMGYSREEFAETDSVQLTHPDDRSEDEKQFNKMLSGEVDQYTREKRFIRKDGSILHCEVSIGCIRKPDGQLDYVLGLATDITARKEAEAALRQSEEHFRLLVEQASDGIFLVAADSRYLDVNSAGANMLGYSRDELLQLRIYDVVVPEETQRIPEEVARLEESDVVSSEWKFLRKDGSCFFGEVAGRKLPDGRLQGIVRDITERKRTQEAIRRNEERFRVALQGSPITVFNQDRELRYTWIYNPRLHWQEAIIGKSDAEIFAPKPASRLSDIKRKVLDTGKAIREEVVIPHEGANYAFDFTIEPLFNADGNVVGITGALVDIAHLRELADSLQSAKDKLVQEKSYLEVEIRKELGFEQIIGQSGGLREALKQARVVAPTDATVLLLGETGTGKELVARSIHALSARHDRNFIKLNCAAVPTGLLESELFGHEKGAFTGAVNQKAGRLELADKGTLFLDEIGELPPELQPKLLRVLQDREFERLGGVRTIKVDVRIVSATNRDLKQDVAEKKFREDLFYRLNVFPIHLPPLRERRSDIPALARHFVNKHAVKMGKRIDNIPDETLDLFQKWSWPGNIRELENVIERMVILSKGNILAEAPVQFINSDFSNDTLTDMEREHIIRVLRETNGVLSGMDGAANRLGVKRTTLQSMLKRFGIIPRDYRKGAGFDPQ